MKKPTLPCSACEAPMWKGRGSLTDGTQKCQPCRRKAAPAVKAVRNCADCGGEYTARGRRCNPCKWVWTKANAKSECSECDNPAIARGLCSNHYSQTQREKHGRVYADGKRKMPHRECAICKEPVTRAFESTEVAIHKKCRAQFPGKATRILRGKISLKRKMAEARVDKAARGTRSNRVFVAGGCSWCGTYFVGAGVYASYCSDKCKTTATFKKRSSGKTFKVSPKKRREIYERDGWTCRLCSHPVSESEHYLSDFAASLDHIIPQSLQLVPDHSASNLRLVHRWCNSSRGDGSNMSDAEFRRRVIVKFGEVGLAA